jgi:hypothetical protein
MAKMKEYEIQFFASDGTVVPTSDGDVFNFWGDNLVLAADHATTLLRDANLSNGGGTVVGPKPATAAKFRRLGTRNWRRVEG